MGRINYLPSDIKQGKESYASSVACVAGSPVTTGAETGTEAAVEVAVEDDIAITSIRFKLAVELNIYSELIEKARILLRI